MKIKSIAAFIVIIVACSLSLFGCNNKNTNPLTCAQAILIDEQYSIDLPYGSGTFDFNKEISVAKGYSYKVSKDNRGLDVYETRVVDILSGSNTFYVLLFKNGNYIDTYIYIINVALPDDIYIINTANTNGQLEFSVTIRTGLNELKFSVFPSADYEVKFSLVVANNDEYVDISENFVSPFYTFNTWQTANAFNSAWIRGNTNQSGYRYKFWEFRTKDGYVIETDKEYKLICNYR